MVVVVTVRVNKTEVWHMGVHRQGGWVSMQG